MKKILFITLICGGFSFGQIQTPQPSPFSKIEQVVGLTDVVINYSRPAMRNRTIMGELVPYGEMWRAEQMRIPLLNLAMMFVLVDKV